jgi:hypothetical protein
MTSLLMALTFGPSWPKLALRALGGSLPAWAFASVFVLLRLPLGSDPSLVQALAFSALSALAYGVLVLTFWPRVGAAFVNLVRRPSKPAGPVTRVR